MFKNILSLSLAMLMIFILAACGSKDGNEKSNAGNAYIVKGSTEDEVVELGTVNSPLNPQTVYSNLTYSPQMFYGDYRLFGGENAEKKYASEMEYLDYVVDGKTSALTCIPFRIRAGHNTWANILQYVEEYNWMEVYFYHKYSETGEPTLDTVECAYNIDGNKLILKPLKAFNYDKESKKITYEFSETVWDYEFSFSGRNLTLSKDGKSVK